MRLLKLTIYALLLSSLLNALPNYPKATKKRFIFKNNGKEFYDDYHWMKNKENPEVLKFINAENNFTAKTLESLTSLQDSIYQESLSHIQENDLSYPVKRGDYYYYFESVKGLQYYIYYRKFKSLDAKPEELFNPNEESKKYKFYEVGFYKISPDQNKLAFTVDTKGNERYTLYIKDLNTGKIEEKAKAVDDFVWLNDNKSFYYVTVNDQFRSDKLYLYKDGNSKQIFSENNDKFVIWIFKTSDKKYIILGDSGKLTSKCYYLNINHPEEEFTLFQKQKDKVDYVIDHHENNFFIKTNENAPDYKLLKVVDLKNHKYETIFPSQKNVILNDFSLFKDFFVFSIRENGMQKIQIMNLKTKEKYFIPIKEKLYSISQGSNYDYDTQNFRFSYETYLNPEKICLINMKTKKIKLLKKDKVNNYNPKNYVEKCIYAPTKDGVKIPIKLVYKKGIKLDGKNPLLLYAYGSYGDCEDPYFSSSRLALMDRGFIWADASIRGGGEMGKYWHDQGKMLNRKNTFNDFINCAEFLIHEKYTNANLLFAEGGSAGGMVMGAIANMRPDLFKGILAEVPFVDVLNTMLDESLPLTAGEYDEWGNPKIKKYFDYIKSYSPYDNVKKQKYPNILITTSFNDTRVGYWEPLKWTAKLQENNLGKSKILLQMDMNAGHAGASGRYSFYKDIAFEYAFIIHLSKK